MAKKRYSITLSGCDDLTTFEEELTSREFALLKRLAERSKEVSTYGCMPVLKIQETTSSSTTSST